MNANDTKIMELKKQIEIKKEKLKKSERFMPITNCIIEFEGAKHNLQVLQKDKLISLLIKLHTYARSAEQLDLLDEYKISGFGITDWITDLKAKIDFMSRTEEQLKLKKMEEKLHQLLSTEKKVELELEEIESMLK